jgi:hypothetical protein
MDQSVVLKRSSFQPFVIENVYGALTRGRNEYWTFDLHTQAGSVYNNDEIKPSLKLWKKKQVECLKCNFRTYKFHNRLFYYFIIQPKDDKENCPFCSIGMFVDDVYNNRMLVSGYGFFCRHEKNREAIWKYLGSKE